jgi:hypothetical protein
MSSLLKPISSTFHSTSLLALAPAFPPALVPEDDEDGGRRAPAEEGCAEAAVVLAATLFTVCCGNAALKTVGLVLLFPKSCDVAIAGAVVFPVESDNSKKIIERVG